MFNAWSIAYFKAKNVYSKRDDKVKQWTLMQLPPTKGEVNEGKETRD